MSTGFPDADARDDFSRVRRQRALASLRARLGLSSEAEPILLFEEVTRALGRVGQRQFGLQVIPLDSIAGTVDRGHEYDRFFRPTSNRQRQRWERIAAAMRRGQALPPIDVYRVGEVHFVRDGHHRVSVARALGRDTIDAYVTEILTAEPALAGIRLADLPRIDHRRLFRERVPLDGDQLARIELSEPWDYSVLAEGVEAWGYRRSESESRLLDRQSMARLWFDEEFTPVVQLLRDSDLVGDRSDAEAYVRWSAERYRLLRTHAWTADVIERLRHLREDPR